MFCGRVPVLEPQQNNLLKREKGPRIGFSRPILTLEFSDDCKRARLKQLIQIVILLDIKKKSINNYDFTVGKVVGAAFLST